MTMTMMMIVTIIIFRIQFEANLRVLRLWKGDDAANLEIAVSVCLSLSLSLRKRPLKLVELNEQLSFKIELNGRIDVAESSSVQVGELELSTWLSLERAFSQNLWASKILRKIFSFFI